MRNVFLVGAKLLGIFSFYQALTKLIDLRYVFKAMQQPDDDLVLQVGSYFLSTVILFLFGYLLAFKTSWLANFVRVPEPDDNLPQFTSQSALNIGLILIGVFHVLRRIPALIQVTFLYRSAMHGSQAFPSWLLFLTGEILGLILAILLIFFSRKVVDIIFRDEKGIAN